MLHGSSISSFSRVSAEPMPCNYNSANLLGDLMDAEDDAPVIRLINAILGQAVREKASDIHIEPHKEKLPVRFRVDGVLNEPLKLQRC